MQTVQNNYALADMNCVEIIIRMGVRFYSFATVTVHLALFSDSLQLLFQVDGRGPGEAVDVPALHHYQ